MLPTYDLFKMTSLSTTTVSHSACLLTRQQVECTDQEPDW
jgi:hypothetical protein